MKTRLSGTQVNILQAVGRTRRGMSLFLAYDVYYAGTLNSLISRGLLEVAGGSSVPTDDAVIRVTASGRDYLRCMADREERI
jgi:hypothetical protein